MQYSSLWMVGISQPLNASTNITFVTHPKRLKRTSHLTQVCLRAHWVVILHEFASKDLKLLIFFLSVLVESDVRVNTSAAQVPVLWSAAEQVTNDTRQTAVEPVRTGHALQQIRYCERFAKGQAEVPEVLQKRVWRHRGHRHRIEGAHQAALLPVKRRARGLQRRAPPRISLHALWPVFRQIAQEDPRSPHREGPSGRRDSRCSTSSGESGLSSGACLPRRARGDRTAAPWKRAATQGSCAISAPSLAPSTVCRWIRSRGRFLTRRQVSFHSARRLWSYFRGGDKARAHTGGSPPQYSPPRRLHDCSKRHFHLLLKIKLHCKHLRLNDRDSAW